MGADWTGVEVYRPVTSSPSNGVLVETVTEEERGRGGVRVMTITPHTHTVHDDFTQITNEHLLKSLWDVHVCEGDGGGTPHHPRPLTRHSRC